MNNRQERSIYDFKVLPDEFHYYGSRVKFKTRDGDLLIGTLARVTHDGLIEVIHDRYPVYGEFMRPDRIISVVEVIEDTVLH